MRKLDRLGWADGLCFTSYGLRIGIQMNEPELLERLLGFGDVALWEEASLGRSGVLRRPPG